jgi:hypothetical protein
MRLFPWVCKHDSGRSLHTIEAILVWSLNSAAPRRTKSVPAWTELPASLLELEDQLTLSPSSICLRRIRSTGVGLVTTTEARDQTNILMNGMTRPVKWTFVLKLGSNFQVRRSRIKLLLFLSNKQTALITKPYIGKPSQFHSQKSLKYLWIALDKRNGLNWTKTRPKYTV